jgi:hypothetical protein
LSVTDSELTAQVNTLTEKLSGSLPLHRLLVLWRLYQNDYEGLGIADEITVDVSNEARRQFLIIIRDRKLELDATVAKRRRNDRAR